jgi:hypothetical protein
MLPLLWQLREVPPGLGPPQRLYARLSNGSLTALSPQVPVLGPLLSSLPQEMQNKIDSFPDGMAKVRLCSNGSLTGWPRSDCALTAL